MKIFSSILGGAAMLLSACGPAADDSAETRAHNNTSQVTWRLSSTFPSTLLMLGTMGTRVVNTVHTLTGGSVDIHFHEPGVLAPPFETFDAVRYGAIEAGWSTSGYWAGKEPALQLFSSIPFGPDAPEYLAWYDYGGGREIFEDIYARHNIHGIICGLSPPEASGWFKTRISSIEDFKGLKIRFFGLGGKVLGKLGAAPQLIAGGEIYQALELGTIDASEYAMPAVDERLGLNEVADHYYFPGWHQQSTFFELIINKDAWNGLSDIQQAQIEAACSANVRYGMSEGEALQTGALARLEAKGVQIEEWPPDVLTALEAAWAEVAAELSSSNKDFKRAYDSLSEFRANYARWRSLGYLKD